MFQIQESLAATEAILRFYCTPYTTNKTEKTDGRIIAWDKATENAANSILIPNGPVCNIKGIRAKEQADSGIYEIELGEPYTGPENRKIRIPLSFYRLEISGEHQVLASIRTDDGVFPGIVRLGEDKFVFAFDPGQTAKNILTYEYLEKKAASGVFTWINKIGSAAATKMPLALTNYMIKKYLEFTKSMTKDTGYPAWPTDDSVDSLRRVLLETMAMASENRTVSYAPYWPQKKKWCFCSTHDVDTAGGFMNIPFVRKAEEKYSIPSSWYVVHDMNPDIGFLKNLEKDGCEVGSHGWVHDDKWRLLSNAEREDRLKKSIEQFRGLAAAGFRAPYNGFSPDSFPKLKEYFEYDTSAQETRIYASVRAHRLGCCTQFPYEVNGIIEVPTTMPPDYLLKNTLGQSPDEVYTAWSKKLSQIKDAGGMAAMQTHPEDYDIGNLEYIKAYEHIISDVCSMKENCWITTAKEIARWWKTRGFGEEKIFLKYANSRFTETRS